MDEVFAFLREKRGILQCLVSCPSLLGFVTRKFFSDPATSESVTIVGLTEIDKSYLLLSSLGSVTSCYIIYLLLIDFQTNTFLRSVKPG